MKKKTTTKKATARTTIEQERAKHALDSVREVSDHQVEHGQGGKGSGDSVEGRYRVYCNALPTQIVMSGLGQAVATLMERKQRPKSNAYQAGAYEKLLAHLSSWLCRTGGPYGDSPVLIDAIVASDQETYVRAHADALAYLVWLKKFAQALLKASEKAVRDDG